MTASEAFVKFVSKVLIPAKAKRFSALASTTKGQRSILDALSHDLERAVRSNATKGRHYEDLWTRPCFVFHCTLEFGIEIASVRDAYERLAKDESWLILLQDGSAGIHRPEGHWDNEMIIA
ncbi:MAG: hypothetical protein ACR2FY_06580 [Pirellulaceae bacterium]